MGFVQTRPGPSGVSGQSGSRTHRVRPHLGGTEGRGGTRVPFPSRHKALGVEVERPENRGQWSQCVRADLLLPRPSLGRLPAAAAARKRAEEKGLAANPTGKHARGQEKQVQEQGAPGEGDKTPTPQTSAKQQPRSVEQIRWAAWGARAGDGKGRGKVSSPKGPHPASASVTPRPGTVSA